MITSIIRGVYKRHFDAKVNPRFKE